MYFEFVILCHMNLIFLCDAIDMWSFQLRCWSTITPKHFTLVTLCIDQITGKRSAYPQPGRQPFMSVNSRKFSRIGQNCSVA